MNIFFFRTQLDGSLLLSCFGVPFRTTFEEFDKFEEIDEAVCEADGMFDSLNCAVAVLCEGLIIFLEEFSNDSVLSNFIILFVGGAIEGS